MDEIIEALINLERAILSKDPRIGTGVPITEIKVISPVADFLRYSYDRDETGFVIIDYRHKKGAGYVMSIAGTDIYEDRYARPTDRPVMDGYYERNRS